MPSFKSVFLFATAVLVGVVSAQDGATVPTRHNVKHHREITRRCGCSSVPDLLTDMQTRIGVVSDNLHAAVGTEATVDIEVIKPHLEMLQGALGAAVEDVHAMASLDLKAILTTSKGEAVTVAACAELLVNLFVAICTFLSVAVQVCAKSQVAVCTQIITGVGAVLFSFLHGLFAIVIDIKVSFCDLLKVHAEVLAIIKTLNLGEVVNLLKVSIQL